MSTSAVLGSGVLVQRGNGASPEVFTTIPEVTTIPPVGETSEQVEVTHLNSTAKEYIAGLPDGSTLALAMNFVEDNVTQEALLTDYANKTQRHFRIVFVGGTNFRFTGVVLGWEVAGGPNTAIIMTVTIKISGSVTRLN